MAVTVRIKTGGKETMRDLDAIRDGLARELKGVKAEAAQLIAGSARGNMRVGPGPRAGAKNANDRLPHIRDTIYASPSGIRSRHPAAMVWEYGGEIRPHGGAIQIPRLEMAQRGARDRSAEIERLMRRRVDELVNSR